MASLQKISYGHTEIDEDVTEGSRATYTLTGIGTSQTADAMTIYAKHELKDIGDGISDGQAQWWKLSTFTTNGLTTRNLEVSHKSVHSREGLANSALNSRRLLPMTSF